MLNKVNLGPLEQQVMDAVWEYKILSVRQVMETLKKRKIAYTTVATILTRLSKKGYLEREKKGRAFVYFPRKSREQTAKGVIKNIVDSLVDQYGKEAVTAFTDELNERK